MKNPQKTIDKTLKFIAQKGYQNKNNNFLKAVAEFLVNLFDVDYVIIDKYSLQTPSKVDSIVVFSKEGLLPNISYKLANTPCENVIDKGICTYPNNIQTLFPKDEMLVQMNIESYIGIPLWSSLGEPIGLITVLHSKPISDTITIETILQIVAIKAAQVLEKLLFDNVLELKINDLNIANQKLKENDKRFNQIIENSKEWVWEIDLNGLFTYSNRLVNNILGYKPEEIIGKKYFFDFFHPEDLDNVKKSSFETLKKRQPFFESIMRNVHKNGKTVWISTNGVPLLDNKGIVIGYRGADTDVTEKILTNKALEDSRNHFKTIIEQNGDAMFLFDFEGNILDVNNLSCKSSGYSREELLSMKISDLDVIYNKLSIKKKKEFWKKINLGKPQTIETIYKCKGGSVYPVEIRINHFINDNKQVILGFTRNISSRKQTEQEIIEKEEKFSKVFYDHPTAMEIVNISTGERIDANESYFQCFEYDKKEFFKGNVFTEKLLLNHEHIELNNKKLLKEGFFKNSDLSIKSKTGKIKNFIVSGTRLNIGDGNLAILTFLEVTNQKKSEETLKRNEEKFKKLANLTFEGILISHKGITLDVNKSFLKMFGYNFKELLGVNVKSILFAEKYHNLITTNRIKGDIKPYEIEGIRKDGSTFIVEIESRNINIGNGITHRVSSFRDLTERKKTEVENIKFSAVLEQSANTIVITNIHGNIEYTNPKFTEVTGYTTLEAFGKNPSLLSSGKQPKEFYQHMWETIKSGKIWKGQFQNKAKNGTIFWEQSTITPIKNIAGQIINYLAIKENITERKKSEDQLKIAYKTIKEKEDYLSTVLETTNEGFWTINNEGITLEVNPEMCKILGRSQKNIIGKSIFEFVDKENTKVFIKQLKIRDEGLSSTYEVELQKSNAKNIPCLFKTSPIYNSKNEKIGSFAMVTDISELKKAYEISENQNQELRKLSYELSYKNTLLLESNDRFKNLFEQSPVSIWEQDFSEAIALLLKKKAETHNLETYLNENPEFVIKCISKIKVLNVNKATLELLRVKNKEELLAHILKTDSKKAINAVKNELLSFVNSETEFKDETEFIRTDGEVISAIIKSTLINNEGKVIASIIDVSALKKALKKAEESDRLKTEFLNNMSHEIRTPMNGILGFSQMLNEPDLAVEKRKYFVNIIQNSGNQLLHVIDDIIEISRLGTKQVVVINEEVCLNDLLLELFSIFDIKAKENKTPLYLKKELSDKESTIITDKSKLNKIMSNLLENALKFTNEGSIEFGYNIKNNNKFAELEIYVKDTGIGINPKKHRLIFERFEQAEKELTKKIGGLGLGLAIAKENTELLCGKISVKSEMMKGATFYVTIPFNPVFIDLKSEDKQNKYTILIAEDEEVNYMYIETVLTDVLKLDCKIFHAKNGLEVIDFCKNNKEIDIILMDLKMPVLNGYEATKEIRKFNSDVPIIAQTAYTSKGDKEKAISAGCNEFISKPINKELFSSVINNFLNIG